MTSCIYCGADRIDMEFAAAEQDTCWLPLCCAESSSLEELQARVTYWPETGLVTVA